MDSRKTTVSMELTLEERNMINNHRALEVLRKSPPRSTESTQSKPQTKPKPSEIWKQSQRDKRVENGRQGNWQGQAARRYSPPRQTKPKTFDYSSVSPDDYVQVKNSRPTDVPYRNDFKRL